MFENVAVVINTCDFYKFIWEGWNYFFQKYWNFDIPWKIYFCTEEEGVDFPNIINLKIGKCPWGEYIHRVSNLIPEETLFLMMDDHFPIKKLDDNFMYDFYKLFEDYEMNRLGLMSCYHPLKDPVKKLSVEYYYSYIDTLYKQTKQSDYLSCFQPSLWNKEFLCKIIQEDWNPWKGEINGTIEIRNYLKGYNTNIGYIIEDDWYIEAITEGVPRDDKYGLNNYRRLIEDFGWKGI